MSLSEKTFESLEEFLERNKISLEDFKSKKRTMFKFKREFITQLHTNGLTWNEMSEVSGMSIGSIARWTQAKGCEATKRNRIENGVLTGKSRKGEKKPWLSKQMKKAWAEGKFDTQINQKLSEKQKEKLKNSWTKERKIQASKAMGERWATRKYRDKLMEYHTSKEERARRSKAQVERMQNTPELYIRGKHSYVQSPKCLNKKGSFLVRSSYEKKMIEIINSSKEITAFEYEKRFHLKNGKYILPDFILHMNTGIVKMVEVKAKWVFISTNRQKILKRLESAWQIAISKGFKFEIWCEQELGLE